MGPLRAIQLKCGLCGNHPPHKPELCTEGKCPLWQFRLGTDPERRDRGQFNSPRLRGGTDAVRC